MESGHFPNTTGLVFNIQGRGILICGGGAALGWLVYLLSMDFIAHDIMSAFLAAMSMGKGRSPGL